MAYIFNPGDLAVMSMIRKKNILTDLWQGLASEWLVLWGRLWQLRVQVLAPDRNDRTLQFTAM